MRWVGFLLLVLAGCPSQQRARQSDPASCENDPKCAARQRVFDCSRQCSDDPACVDRCREVNAGTGQTGR